MSARATLRGKYKLKLKNLILSRFLLTRLSWQLSFIAADLKNTNAAYWVPNALVVVQAVVGPIMCLASDTFQVRKELLIGSCLISMVGAGIAPGSKNIYRLIAAQVLIGFGFSGIPLTFVVPSEILPRKWRPSKFPARLASNQSTDTLTPLVAQAVLNIASCMASISGSLIGGSLITRNGHTGWRDYYVCATFSSKVAVLIIRA